ncbi:MAG: hypothetical protein ACK4FF_05465 [Limnobacter sp.]|uniref:hypothetical protein n=1 Tax=Limnobacter sp. TaxID=2003368 RepID=UPI00391A2F1E
MHSRIQIRQAVKTALQGTPGLVNIYTGRVQPSRAARMPFARIETGTEVSEKHTDQWTEIRTVQVFVHVYAQADEQLDDVLDAVAEQVEQRLAVDQTLGGVCESFIYKGAESDEESAARVEDGLLSLQFECVYVWQPSLVLDSFTVASVQIDMASPRNDPPIPTEPDGQIDASVRINLPS